MFADYSSRRGEEIAQLIMDNLEEHAIHLSGCRAEGYDNAANMAERYKGAQAQTERQNGGSPCGLCVLWTVAILSPCGCHALN